MPPKIKQETHRITYLPPAKLFLEDIEELIGIMEDAEKYVESIHDDDKKSALTLTIEVNEYECKSISDVKELIGRVKKTKTFKISIERKSRFFDISITGSQLDQVRFDAYGLTDDGRLATFARIRDIFERRKMKFRAMLASMPDVLRFSGYVLYWLTLAYVIAVPRELLKDNVVFAGLLVSFGILVILITIGMTDDSSSVLVLGYSYERTGIWEKVKERATFLLWMLFTAIASAIATFYVTRFLE